MAKYFSARTPARRSEDAQRLIILACFFGLLSSIAFLHFSAHKGQNQKSSVVAAEQITPKTVQVLVPHKEIKPGTLLTPTLFRVETRPAVAVNERVINNFEEVIGQYSRSVLLDGLPVYRGDLTSDKVSGGFIHKIASGFRAIAIKVEKRGILSRMVIPGVHVDVLCVVNHGSVPEIRVIVENALVLSVERYYTDELKPSTVTLQVTQKEAAMIQLASATGTLGLVYRKLPCYRGKKGELLANDLSQLRGLKPLERSGMPDGYLIVDGEKFSIINGELKKN